jgi:UDP-N-acetylglucosamine acyltransferase
MNYVHIGHDCRIGNNVTLVNYCGLAGHVIIDDNAMIGVSCGVHQFARIGSHSFIAHGTMVSQDVPPYIMVTGGSKATPCGINVEGLKRSGFTRE